MRLATEDFNVYVVLFDIDGTLISSQKAKDEEKQRFKSAIRDIAGEEPPMSPADFAGMVDPQICKILLTEIGLTEKTVEDLLPKVVVRMGEVYRAMTKRLVLNNGVDALLRRLAESQSHVLGVLTGNVSEVGSEKLIAAGLKSYFSVGFYADGYLDRTRLVRDAVNTCVNKYHLPGCKNVVIVGDTPRDITAANAANATSIGIASGTFSESQLSDAGATWVFRDLTPSPQLLRVLGCGN